MDTDWVQTGVPVPWPPPLVLDDAPLLFESVTSVGLCSIIAGRDETTRTIFPHLLDSSTAHIDGQTSMDWVYARLACGDLTLSRIMWLDRWCVEQLSGTTDRAARHLASLWCTSWPALHSWCLSSGLSIGSMTFTDLLYTAYTVKIEQAVHKAQSDKRKAERAVRRVHRELWPVSDHPRQATYTPEQEAKILSTVDLETGLPRGS